MVASPDLLNVGYYLGWSAHSLPCHWGRTLEKKQKWLFFFSFFKSFYEFHLVNLSFYRVKMGIRISCNTTNIYQQVCQAGLCMNVIMTLNGILLQSQSSVRNQFSSQGSCHAASAIPRKLVPASSGVLITWVKTNILPQRAIPELKSQDCLLPLFAFKI